MMARSICAATIGLIMLSCTKTKFDSNKNNRPTLQPAATQSPEPVSRATISPNELDSLDKLKPVIQDPPKTCAKTTRAVRIAVALDTSLSNGLADCSKPIEANQILQGSDPAKLSNSARNKVECNTDRQNAIFTLIKNTIELDAKARTLNPQYLGSEVGVLQFPAIVQGQPTETFAKLSGQPPLNETMTNLSALNVTEAFYEGLWTLLGRTHQSAGNTPYLAALDGGKELLKAGRNADDPRQDYLFLITDGLPSDQRPSAVIEAFQKLQNVQVVYFYLFDPKTSEASKFEAAKSALRDAFENKMWARRAGNTDGYGAGDFEKYWNALLELPSKISTVKVDVNKSDELLPKLNSVLNIIQSCP